MSLYLLCVQEPCLKVQVDRRTREVEAPLVSQVRSASHLQEHGAGWGRPAWPTTQESSEWSACNRGDTLMAGVWHVLAPGTALAWRGCAPGLFPHWLWGPQTCSPPGQACPSGLFSIGKSSVAVGIHSWGSLSPPR